MKSWLAVPNAIGKACRDMAEGMEDALAAEVLRGGAPPPLLRRRLPPRQQLNTLVAAHALLPLGVPRVCAGELTSAHTDTAFAASAARQPQPQAPLSCSAQ